MIVAVIVPALRREHRARETDNKNENREDAVPRIGLADAGDVFRADARFHHADFKGDHAGQREDQNVMADGEGQIGGREIPGMPLLNFTM